MPRQFQVLLEWDPQDEIWVTYVPALDLLSTYGETRQEALDHTREAVQGYLEAARLEGITVPAEHLVELVSVTVLV